MAKSCIFFRRTKIFVGANYLSRKVRHVLESIQEEDEDFYNPYEEHEEEEEEHDDEETSRKSRSEQEPMSNDAIADTSSSAPCRKNEKIMSENSPAHQHEQELASEQEDGTGDRASQLPILNPPQQMEEDADSSDDERSLEYKPPGSTRALGFSADDHDGHEFGDWNASDDEDLVDI